MVQTFFIASSVNFGLKFVSIPSELSSSPLLWL
jgi:hypothetical protein